MKKILTICTLFFYLNGHSQLLSKDKQIAKLNQFGNMIELWQNPDGEYYIQFLNKEYNELVDVQRIQIGSKDDYTEFVKSLNLVDKEHDFQGPTYHIVWESGQLFVFGKEQAFFFITKKHIKEFEKIENSL